MLKLKSYFLIGFYLFCFKAIAFDIDSCIGSDNRSCQVTGYGTCIFEDNGQKGELFGHNQVCVPLKTKDDPIAFSMWFDDSAKLNENRSYVTGQNLIHNCGERQKRNANEPNETWNMVMASSGYNKKRFWVTKYFLNKSGICTLAILPVINIVHPNLKKGEVIGEIHIDESQPIKQIQKPGAFTVYNETQGSMEITSLMPKIQYQVVGQSGIAHFAFNYYPSVGFGRRATKIPENSISKTSLFLKYINYFYRNVNVESDCVSGNTLSTVSNSEEGLIDIINKRKKIDGLENWIEDHLRLSQLPVCE